MEGIFLISIFILCITGLPGCSREVEKTELAAAEAMEQPDSPVSQEQKPFELKVFISPENPTVKDTLRGNAQTTQFIEEWIWYRNDEEMTAQEGPDLPSHNAVRGDRITLTVRAGGQEASDSVVIDNSPPEVIGVGLVTNAVHRGVDITVLPEGVDLDGDPVEFRYYWFINGEEEAFEKSATLPGDKFKKGDSVALQVVPTDGIDEGSPFLPEPFTIPNAPPEFTSKPPAQFSGFEYSYQSIAQDPDGDRLNYRIEKGPEGMVIDEETGLVTWPVSRDRAGNHPVRITVSDEEGLWKSQEFTLLIAVEEKGNG